MPSCLMFLKRIQILLFDRFALLSIDLVDLSCVIRLLGFSIGSDSDSDSGIGDCLCRGDGRREMYDGEDCWRGGGGDDDEVSPASLLRPLRWFFHFRCGNEKLCSGCDFAGTGEAIFSDSVYI